MQIGFRSPPRLRTIACASVAVATVAGALASGGSAVAAKHGHKPKHGNAHHGRLSISHQSWGTADGKTVQLFTLRNSRGMIVKITNYGGVVQSIWVPDRNGKLTNVALGFPKLSDYVTDFTNPTSRRLRRHVLRRDHRPLREPHRRREVHPRQQGLSAGIRTSLSGDSDAQQRAEPASRRAELLQHAGVGRDDEHDRQFGAADPQLHRSELQERVPGNGREHGYVLAEPERRPGDRVQGDHGCADRGELHQPHVLQPGW